MQASTFLKQYLSHSLCVANPYCFKIVFCILRLIFGNSSGTSTGMGSRFFQFVVKSNSSTGSQNISYQIASNAITNTTPFSANPGTLRTMYLSRIA